MGAKKITTFSEYISDESRVTPMEREKIDFEVALIGKMIELRKKRGLSQRELANLSGLKQPAIARLESFQSMPQIDTLIKALRPLGYTISLTKL